MQVAGFAQSTDGWLTLPDASADSLVLTNITLGSRTGAAIVDAWIQSLWVATAAIDITTVATATTTAADYYKANTVPSAAPPAISMDQMSSNLLTSLVVGGPVTVAVAASSTTSRVGLKLRMTFYGVAPR